MKKYEFTGEEKPLLSCGVMVKRIRRLSDGAIGGWIESEKNLDVSGNAWISGDALVYGNAQISGNARISGNALVYGNARISGDALVGKPLDFVFISGLRFPVTVRNDGFASIGCQTKSISDWLKVTFADQPEIPDQDEFDRMRALLRPIFEAYHK